MKEEKKKLSIWKVVLIIIGIFVFIGGIIDFIEEKLHNKNIDCDEYNENLESLKDKPIEINFYMDNQTLGDQEKNSHEEDKENIFKEKEEIK